MRAARAATSPALLGASEARRVLPAPAFAETSVVFGTKPTMLLGASEGRCNLPTRNVAVTSAAFEPKTAVVSR